MRLWQRCKDIQIDRWVVVFLIIFVLAESYNGRVGLRNNLINRCTQSSDRALIQANYFERHGDPEDATATRTTIPMPAGWTGQPETRGDDPADIQAGCEDSFPHPSILPWVGH